MNQLGTAAKHLKEIRLCLKIESTPICSPLKCKVEKLLPHQNIKVQANPF